MEIKQSIEKFPERILPEKFFINPLVYANIIYYRIKKKDRGKEPEIILKDK